MKTFFEKQLAVHYRKILTFFFPAFCLGCKERGVFLCTSCIARCALARPSAQEWIYPLFAYHDPIIRKAIWQLKYRERTALAAELAHFLYEYLLAEMEELTIFEALEKPLLIPIPLSKQAHRARGYNQSALLAAHIHAQNKNLCTCENSVLRKIKHTPKQMSIKNRAERLKNLRGCFAVKNAGLIHRRNIILIDDVTTTGATLSEARRVLKKAGAKKVIAFTLAH